MNSYFKIKYILKDVDAAHTLTPPTLTFGWYLTFFFAWFDFYWRLALGTGMERLKRSWYHVSRGWLAWKKNKGWKILKTIIILDIFFMFIYVFAVFFLPELGWEKNSGSDSSNSGIFGRFRYRFRPRENFASGSEFFKIRFCLTPEIRLNYCSYLVIFIQFERKYEKGR